MQGGSVGYSVSEMDDDQLILESDNSWKIDAERKQRKRKSKKGNSQYGQDSTDQYNKFLEDENIDHELFFTEDGQSSQNEHRNISSREKRTVTKLIGDIKKFKKPEESSNSQQEESSEFENLFSNMKKKEENAFYNQTQQGNQGVHESMLGKRRRAGIYGSNRKYVSKRIYFCGSCFTLFCFVEELSLHIRQTHKGEVPDGTIFGLKKQALFKFFHIPVSKPVVLPHRKVYLFKCGCGKEYSCSSSLYYHITASHNNVEPPGTIGIVNSVRIK